MKLQGVQQREGRAVMHIRVCSDMALDVHIQHDGRNMLRCTYYSLKRNARDISIP